MYDETALRLAILATLLVAVRPADVFSKVPSNYHGGTKWVLVRDDNVHDPPPNVIQGDNNVQVLPVLPVYQQSQHLHGQSHVPSSDPVHVPVTPINAESSQNPAVPGHQYQQPHHLQGQSQVSSVPVHVPVSPVHQQQQPPHSQGQFHVPSVPIHVPVGSGYVPPSVPSVLVQVPLVPGHVVPSKHPSTVFVTPKPKPKPKPKPTKDEFGSIVGDFDTEIVESNPGPPPPYSEYEYEHANDYDPSQYDDGQYHDDYKKPRRNHEKPRVKVTTFGVTSVPISAVHVKAPTVIEYFRKKKSA